MKHTDRNRKNIGNCNWLRRALPVVLSALLLCSLTGCSVRDLHIGQVEVNTGVTTAWITPAKGVDKFAIAAGDFSVRDDGTVTYTGTAYRALQGIDVSTFQQEIDWQAVADSGIDFAFIRAGYRGYGKGGIVEDDRFRQNVAGARAAGLRVGLYFFSQAITPEEEAEEAILAGKAPVTACAPAGAEGAAKIAAIMGMEAPSGEKMVAHVLCNGGVNAVKNFEYRGVNDCLAATKVCGGNVLECKYGCFGFGSCVAA